ncbi:hypothetical protein D5a_00360 [Faustovirus]|nr:hypothetical protein D5a_00360 [Faustovirus]
MKAPRHPPYLRLLMIPYVDCNTEGDAGLSRPEAEENTLRSNGP